MSLFGNTIGTGSPGHKDRSTFQASAEGLGKAVFLLGREERVQLGLLK